MKREQLILQTMSDPQLGHARKLLDREIKRRSSAPPDEGQAPRARKSRKAKRAGTTATA